MTAPVKRAGVPGRPGRPVGDAGLCAEGVGARGAEGGRADWAGRAAERWVREGGSGGGRLVKEEMDRQHREEFRKMELSSEAVKV